MAEPMKSDLAPVDALTDEKIANFVKNVISGRRADTAAKMAGFPQPRAAAVKLLNTPAVLEAIEKSVSGRLRGQLAPRALNVIDEILNGQRASKAIKLAAAKTVLDRAGYVPPKAPDSVGDPAKSLSEQSPAELRAFMDAAKRELADRAPIIEGTATVRPAQNRKSMTSKASDDDPEAAGLLD